MAVTINNDGNARPDQYWLLKSHPEHKRTIVNDDGETIIFVAIELEACDLDTYQRSPGVQRQIVALGLWKVFSKERTHGRRVNDEVEVYGMGEEGKETPRLRHDLENMGLTVRSYAQESAKTKFPKFPSRGLVVTQEKTFMDRCSATMLHSITEYEEEISDVIEYALLADPGIDHPRAKHLLVVVVDEAYFEDSVRKPEQLIITNGCEYKVIGYYHEERMSFYPNDEVAKRFFTKDGRYVELRFFDHAKQKAMEAAEALKQERKAAKKLRRQLATSTATAAATEGEGKDSVAGVDGDDGAEDADAKVRAKREKEKAKKKAQQVKKKAKQMEDAEEAQQAITLSREVEARVEVKRERGGGLMIWHFKDESDGEEQETVRRPMLRASASEVISDYSDDEDDEGQGTGDSSSEDTNPGGDGMTVVKVADMAGARKAMEEAEGEVMVMSQQDVDLEAGEYNTGLNFFKPTR
ncbi:hypothetical protein LTR08_004265 [Meristemomyces frigidus]|nr:hypothetical protein LTR08_004265 [Meristemomyces frigidus]